MKFWKDEFRGEEIEFVFNKLKEMRTLSPEGKVSFTGGFGGLETRVSFLVSASKFEVRTDTLRTKIIKEVLFSPNLKANFSEADFRKIAYQLRNKFQNIEIKPYKVVFPIWNKPEFLFGQKRIGDVTVNFTPSKKSKPYKKIISERGLQKAKQGYEVLFTKSNLADLEKCSICITHVKANSPFDANERASEAVYEILGLVNLAKDRGKYRRISFRTAGNLPVSEVLIGPHTTTHFANGALTHDGFWHENWIGGPKHKLDSKKVQAWERRYDKLSRGVARSPWRNQCKSALARYYKAFSNPNLEETFLEGWRLFENITGDRSQTIAEKLYRASNVFGNNIEPDLPPENRPI